MDDNLKAKIKDLTKDIPESIPIPTIMSGPNAEIDIYNGPFTLCRDEESISVVGRVWYCWQPSISVLFDGTVQSSSAIRNNLEQDNLIGDMFINSLYFGSVYSTMLRIADSNYISGILRERPVLGDRSIHASKFRFALPNFRDIYGDATYTLNERGLPSIGTNRLQLDGKDYRITIDKSRTFKSDNKKLEKEGGYQFLYSGVIMIKNGSVGIEAVQNIIEKLGYFLSFTNGRRTIPTVIEAIHDGQTLWTTYNTSFVDQYKYVFSWLSYKSIEGMPSLWLEFSNLWDDNSGKDFLKSVIHWYIEANNNSGYLEGSVILTQVALELLYNYILIEKNNVIQGNDRLTAANKLRLLVAFLRLERKVPESFKELQQFIESDTSLTDGIDVFVYYRNSIVHSSDSRRSKLTGISTEVKSQIRKLGLWYVEVAILRILGFRSKYRFRCSDAKWEGDNERSLPD